LRGYGDFYFHFRGSFRCPLLTLLLYTIFGIKSSIISVFSNYFSK
jgi:hypothetical protein